MEKAGGMLIGALVAIMVTFNGVLGDYSNVYLSTFIVHLVGLIVIGSYLFFKKHLHIQIQGIPFYLFLGGGAGILLVTLNNICFSTLGVSLTLALGLLGQAVLSTVVDHFGLLGMPIQKFEIKKIPGFALIVAGIIAMSVL